MEEWRDIPGYEGLYQVSDLGNVRSLNGFGFKGKIHVLKPGEVRGYKHVRLYKNDRLKTHRIHLLVAMAFFGHKPNSKIVVDHIDDNSLNNRLDNLQIITQSENVKKSYKS
jgi:hypothetical protein